MIQLFTNVAYDEWMNFIDSQGHGSKVKAIMGKLLNKPCELNREQTLKCILIKSGTDAAMMLG